MKPDAGDGEVDKRSSGRKRVREARPPKSLAEALAEAERRAPPPWIPKFYRDQWRNKFAETRSRARADEDIKRAIRAAGKDAPRAVPSEDEQRRDLAEDAEMLLAEASELRPDKGAPGAPMASVSEKETTERLYSNIPLLRGGYGLRSFRRDGGALPATDKDRPDEDSEIDKFLRRQFNKRRGWLRQEIIDGGFEALRISARNGIELAVAWGNMAVMNEAAIVRQRDELKGTKGLCDGASATLKRMLGEPHKRGYLTAQSFAPYIAHGVRNVDDAEVNRVIDEVVPMIEKIRATLADLYALSMLADKQITREANAGHAGANPFGSGFCQSLAHQFHGWIKPKKGDPRTTGFVEFAQAAYSSIAPKNPKGWATAHHARKAWEDLANEVKKPKEPKEPIWNRLGKYEGRAAGDQRYDPPGTIYEPWEEFAARAARMGILALLGKTVVSSEIPRLWAEHMQGPMPDIGTRAGLLKAVIKLQVHLAAKPKGRPSGEWRRSAPRRRPWRP